MIEKNYYLGFSLFPGIGPKKFEKLIQEFGSAKNAWNSKTEKLIPIVGKSLVPRFEKFRFEFNIREIEDELSTKDIKYLALSDRIYPNKLKKISNPPIVLYVLGSVDFNFSEEKHLAIVGTRKITTYGKDITKLFSSELATSGLIIVSGLAMGVDAYAHSSCLGSGGKTIAVMGNGVDICFPRENQRIYDEILEKGGSIISEFPPGMSPSAGSFPSRNRIIAGLSDGVLVTEGAQDSGSLITANYGLEFGRKVFAVPGPVTSSLSAAPLKLIEKGARLVVTPDDILKELNVKISKFEKKKMDLVGFSKEEIKIIKLLENENLGFDEIVQKLKTDSVTIATTLSLLEINGVIKSVSSGRYSLV